MENSHPDQDDILLLHEGEITLQDSETLFEKMREMVSAGKAPRSALRTLVELVQNIRLHADSRGTIVVRKNDNSFVIQACNEVPHETAANVCELVRTYNAQASEIAELIHAKRKEALKPRAKGAGLGLMEIRRLSGVDVVATESCGVKTKSWLVITVRLPHK